jgi:hypothetical protein
VGASLLAMGLWFLNHQKTSLAGKLLQFWNLLAIG